MINRYTNMFTYVTYVYDNTIDGSKSDDNSNSNDSDNNDDTYNNNNHTNKNNNETNAISLT
jgi:hypothetical protein